MSDDLLKSGAKLFEEGKLEQAEAIFSKFLSKNPQDPRGLMYRAVVYRKLEKFEKSIMDLDSGINLLPNDAHFYSERGVSKLHFKDLSGALADLDKAQELEPQNSYRYSSRAYLKSVMGDVEGAIKDYERAVELDPQDAIAFNNLGLLEEKRGRVSQAKENFSKADDISKENPDYKGMFGGAMSEEEIEEAREKSIKAAKDEDEKKQSSQAQHTENKVESSSASKDSLGKVYFKTLKSVVTNKEERQSFFKFIKGGLKKKS